MVPVTYFKNYPFPYYPGWQNEPVPGWGAKPVMAGPRMVAVGSFGAEPAKKIDPMFIFNNLWMNLLKEKNPQAVAQNQASFWRKSLKDSYLLLAKANGADGVRDAVALKNGIKVAYTNKFKSGLDLSDLEVTYEESQIKHPLETMKLGATKPKIRVFDLPPAGEPPPAGGDTPPSDDGSTKAGMMDVLTKPWFIALAVIGVASAVYLMKKD
jgi:hypothetical protein